MIAADREAYNKKLQVEHFIQGVNAEFRLSYKPQMIRRNIVINCSIRCRWHRPSWILSI